ncbi:SRPBCC family protein [Prochlorococcus sp. MIT 1307]|uniref:SRPBCC family protein n=1 Tax=Prochlorococcus sp. MIT 1307 TaxID=3096219 RepID=UPI002A76366B|nr:SRPBCC family protein [Prochlorococcus sp. MIT 1307]
MHQTIEQTMERLPNGTRRLAALLRTPISIDSIWNILTDYDNLSNHIPNLVSSKVISRDANRVHLAQVGAQKLMGLRFSAQVQLELIENRDLGVLSFHLIKGDFRRFEGLWKMKQLKENNGTCLLYELTVQGCLGMPVALIEQRLRGDLKTNLLAVEQAALKRK